MFIIRYLYVRAKLALAPNRYTPAEKVALAHEDIDVAKTIILDPNKRVHAGRPDNSLSNNQLIEILQRIYTEELPGNDKNLPKYKKSFWGKFDALHRPQAFPAYESLIPEYDANNLEANRKASESLVEMGLLDLKTLAPEHKVKLAKNSEALAKKIFFGSEKSQNQDIKYIENLQSTHRAEIISHYYASVPAAVANIEAIELARNPLKIPQKSFWERLIYFLMEPKNPDYKAKREEIEKRISEADAAIDLAVPTNFRKNQSKQEKAAQLALYQTTKTTQEQSKAAAMREFYTYLDNADKFNDKLASRLDICLYILQNSPSSGFFNKHVNEIVSTIEQNQDFRTRFVALLTSEDAKHPQQGEKLEGSALREMTSLYNEVIKTFDAQLRVLLSENMSDNPCPCTLDKLSFNDICDIYQSSNESKYFDNLLGYLSQTRINEMQANQDRLSTFLAVVTDEQLITFLVTNIDKFNIFELLHKVNPLDAEKYARIIAQLCTKLKSDQMVNILFNHYQNVNLLKFLRAAQSRLAADTFNPIVITLFKKYDSAKLLELINSCGNNIDQLQSLRLIFDIVKDESDDVKNLSTPTDAYIIKFFLNNALAAQYLNVKLAPDMIVKTALLSQNDDKFINAHATTIIDAAGKNDSAATCLNNSAKLSNLLIHNTTIIDFPLPNIIEAQKFFTDIESYSKGGKRSYSVINLELDDVNRVKAAKLLNCAPEKLQNALLVFTNSEWKKSINAWLLSNGILFAKWDEIDAQYTKPPFDKNHRFVELMTTPRNVIIPLPNPTSIYNISTQLSDQKLTIADPFVKAADEAKGIIASVMKLGKSIADKICQLTGINELLALNFVPPVANHKSAPAAATPPRKDPAKGADNKDKKEKDKKDKTSPPRTEAISSKPAAASPISTNAVSPAAPQKDDNADSSTPTKVVPKLRVAGGAPSATAAANQEKQNVVGNVKKASPELKATDAKNGGSEENFDLTQLERQVEATLAEVNQITGATQSLSAAATPLKAGERTTDSSSLHANPATVATPQREAITVSSPMPIASPASASPNNALSPSQQSVTLMIPNKVDSIAKTTEWLKKNIAKPDAYTLAFAHIKAITAKPFSMSELLSFIKELDLTNRTIFLKQLVDNNQLIQQICQAKSGLLSSTKGSELILEVAKHDAELVVKLYPINVFADKYHEYLNGLKAAGIIELLTKNWNNVLFRNIVVNFIHSQKKTLNLPRDNQEFATLLSTNLDIAVKILSRETIVNSAYLSNFARNNIQAAIKLFSNDNTEQLSDAFLQQLSSQELNIVVAAAWKDDVKRNEVVSYLNKKRSSLTLYLDDKILAEHLVANLNYVIQHNLLSKDNVIPTFLRFGKDFIKQHWLKIFKCAVDNKCKIDANLFEGLTISKEDIAQLQSDYATIALDNVDKQNVAKLFNDPILLKSEFTLVKFTFNSENDRKNAEACLGCKPDQLANAYMMFSSKTHYDNVLNKLKVIGLEHGNHFESIEIYRNLKGAPNKIISEEGTDPISKVLGNNPVTFLVPYPDVKYLAQLTPYMDSLRIDEITKPVLTELRSVIKLNKNIYLKVIGQLYSFSDENKLEEIGVKSMLRPSFDHIEGRNDISISTNKTLPVLNNDTKEAMQARYQKADKDSTAIEAIQILIDDLKYQPQNQISPVKKLALLTKLLTERESDLEAGKNFVKWFIRNCQLNPSPVDIHSLALAYRNASREKNHVNQQLHDAYKKCLEFVIQNEDLQAALSPEQLSEIIREYIYLPNNIQYLFDFLGLKFNATIKTDDIKLANKECVFLVRTDMAAANLSDNPQEQINASQIIDNARKQLLAIYTLKEKVFGKAPLASPIDFERSAHPSAQSRAATTLFTQPPAATSEQSSSARSSQTISEFLSDMQSSSREGDASFNKSPRANG